MRALILNSMFVGTMLLAGCLPSIGNEDGTCSAGESCICDGIGNCDKACEGPGCSFVCEGLGNCNLDCPAGGCTVMCRGTGNCILDCAGGSCTQSCEGTGNCVCNSGCDMAGGDDAGSDTGS